MAVVINVQNILYLALVILQQEKITTFQNFKTHITFLSYCRPFINFAFNGDTYFNLIPKWN